MAKQQQLEIVKDVHEDDVQGTFSKAMASHKGRDRTYSKISERFCWYSIYKDDESFLKSCENCQKQVDLKLKMNIKLHNIRAVGSFFIGWGEGCCVNMLATMFGRRRQIKKTLAKAP